jgi:hypothetical protein
MKKPMFFHQLKFTIPFTTLISCLLLILISSDSSAQLYVTYPNAVQVFTVGSAVTPVVPARAGVNWYSYKSIGSRLDVSPDFMDNPTGIASALDGSMYVGNYLRGGLVRKFTPSGMIPSNDPRTGSFTSMGTGFSNPYSIAVDEKYIYVADVAVGVKRITITSNATTTYGTGLPMPISIAINKKGEVFVGLNGGTVKKIAANGVTTANFGPAFTYPGGLVVDNDGNVFVADASAKTVTKLSPTGTKLETFTGFTSPLGLAMDNAGNLLIGDDRELKLLNAGSTAASSTTTLITRAVGAAYFGVAVDAKGIIYGTDNNLGNLTYLIPKGGFFITPALPIGLTFDYNSGTISGTPLEGSAEQDYTVYGYDSNSTQVTGTVRIKVVSDNADLASLTISAGTLTPDFDPAILDYNASVSNSNITITPTLSDPSATVTVNGNTTNSGVASSSIALNEGLNTLPVVVTSSDGTVKNYSIKITRTIGLSSLNINSGTLSPVFDPNVATYTAIVQPLINSIVVTPVASDPSYTVKVNGTIISAGNPSATIALDNGANIITTEVSAADGLTSKTYTTTITRLLAQTITFPALGNKATGIEDFSPATSDSGLPITYTSSSAARATILNGKVHLVSAGNNVTITAKQAGNSVYAAAIDVSQIMNITKGAGTITFPPLADKVMDDANFAPGATSTNTVTAIAYASSNAAVATITGTGINLRIKIVGAGTTNITASQGTSTNYLASASVIQSLTVAKGVVSIALSDLGYTYDGTAKSATVTTNPTGLSGATITYDGLSTVPINAGSYAVVASLNNANYEAVPVTGTLVISKGTATIALGSLSQNYDGTAKAITATTTPVGLGDITFTYDGLSTVPINAGSYAVVASLNNTNYEAVPVTGTLVIAKGTATIALGSLSQNYDGTAKAITATTTPVGLSDITFTYDGSATVPTEIGNYTVVASLTNVNYTGSATGTLTISKGLQTITFNALSNKNFGDADFVLTATGGASGNAISYVSSDPLVATVSGSTITIVGVGTSTITASQSGNANYNAATDAIQVLRVNKAAQTITFATITDKNLNSADFQPGATTTSGLPISYTSSNSAVAIVYQDLADGNKWKVKIVGNGTTDITADQIGDSHFNAASLTRTLAVVAVTLPITLTGYTAKIEGNRARLAWTTASEQNNNHFEIERSIDGKVFTFMTTIKGNGTTLSAHTYAVYDNNPGNETTYYKLKQYDLNGKVEELGVRSVTFKVDAITSVKIFPNPTTDVVNLSFANYKGQDAKIVITDMLGRTIHTETILLSTGASSYKLNLNNKLMPGQYFINVTGAGLKTVLKLISY